MNICLSFRGRTARRLILSSLTVVLACGVAYSLMAGNSAPGIAVAGGSAARVAQGEVATGHPRIRDPAGLDGARAEAIYRAIVGRLSDAYAMSYDPVAQAYTTWRRYNRYPYRSAQHGDRYVNNYANEIARNYGASGNSGPMPVGSQVAKDSFIVTRNGDILIGPLVLMEKMPPGFDEKTGDWRYMMIDAAGAIVGMTGGPNADRMNFCNECHAKAANGRDRLYFVPGNARLPGTAR